ncbi:unnamed protein product, partial [Leptidea sinapis]
MEEDRKTIVEQRLKIKSLLCKMSVESLTKTFCDSSGSDIIEEDIRIVEVPPLNLHPEVMVWEKRLRSSSDDILEEDGFTTVRSTRAVKIAKMSTRDLSSAEN